MSGTTRILLAVLLMSPVPAMDFGPADLPELKERYNERPVPVLEVLFRNERVRLEIEDMEPVGIVTRGGRIESVVEGGLDDPTMIVRTDPQTIGRLHGLSDLADALDSGDVSYEAVGFLRSAKLRLLEFGLRLQAFLGRERVRDSDGDGLTDVYEVEWGLDPQAGDQDNNGIRDGLDDPDGDNFLSEAEQTLGSDPLDAGDPDLSELEEVEVGELPQLPEPGKAMCRLVCCCEVLLRYQGRCSRWEEGTASGDYGPFNYTPPDGCQACDGQVEGSLMVWDQEGAGDYGCEDTLQFEETLWVVADDCGRSPAELCQEKFGNRCSQRAEGADQSANEAMRACIRHSAAKCVGESFEVINRNSATTSHGSCK